jgi:hypothetical protein
MIAADRMSMRSVKRSSPSRDCPSLLSAMLLRIFVPCVARKAVLLDDSYPPALPTAPPLLMSKQRFLRDLDLRILARMPTLTLSVLLLLLSVAEFVFFYLHSPRFGYFEAPVSRLACLLAFVIELVCAVLEDAWYASPFRKSEEAYTILHTIAVFCSTLCLCSSLMLGPLIELVLIPAEIMHIHIIQPINLHYLFALFQGATLVFGPTFWTHIHWFSLGVEANEWVSRSVLIPLLVYSIFSTWRRDASSLKPLLAMLPYSLSWIVLCVFSVFPRDDWPRCMLVSFGIGFVLWLLQIRMGCFDKSSEGSMVADAGVFLFVLQIVNDQLVRVFEPGKLMLVITVFQLLRLVVFLWSVYVPPPRQTRSILT